MNFLAALKPVLRAQTSSAASASSTALRNSTRTRLASVYSPRSYSTTPPPKEEAKPVKEPEKSDTARSKQAVGPFTLRAAGLFALTGAGLFFYFQSEKEKVAEKKRAETATAKIGKPKIGGPFVLTDQDGGSFSEQDLLGKWSLVYFGFTNCPDICPEELDKMGLVVTNIADTKKVDLLPVFITCDPARDSIAAVKAYVKDFHPSLVGLTGTYEDVKKCCKAYRVYFSTPPSALPTDDYLVDHSIFFYLMDPHGKFVDAFGRSMGPEEVQGKIGGYLKEWEEGGGRGGWTE